MNVFATKQDLESALQKMGMIHDTVFFGGDFHRTLGVFGYGGYGLLDPPKKDTLWLFNTAMQNGLFIDGLPIKNCDFPWLC